ncbi:hypothetical protein [Oceanobacillus sp. FSL K6-0251]|uniref:hypothetical protein n=1 Tax=Oceanobacillus sp. FSL K6-0251 TaxID=2921602 RepID=UPI0030F5E4AD
MIPLINNQSELIETLEQENLVNDVYIILEKLQQELNGVDNSIYQELNIYYYLKNERDEDKTFHFLFAIVPHVQNKVTGNPKNAVIVVEFKDLWVVE